MASDNETVASVTDCIRHMADNMPNGVILNIAQCNFTADRIEAAHRREMEAKDAEVERWRKQALEENDAALVHCAEISKLKALVKELADALDNLDYAFGMEIKRQLVKKAMEVVK